MAENTVHQKPHSLMLERRALLSLTGVEDVVGFDDSTVSVKLADCSLVVKGTALQISKLSLESGDVVIDGTVSSLQYLGGGSKGLRSRLLR